MEPFADIDDLLLQWAAWPGGAELSTDQQLRVRLRVQQLLDQQEFRVELLPGSVGSLICQSPKSQQTFIEFCRASFSQSEVKSAEAV